MATRQDWDKFKRIFSGLFGVEPTYPQPRDTTPSNMIDKYIVQPGDNLTIISDKQKSPVEDLIKANPQLKDPNKLQIGDTLTIPVFVAPPESEIDNVSAKHWGVTGEEGISKKETNKQIKESKNKNNNRIYVVSKYKVTNNPVTSQDSIQTMSIVKPLMQKDKNNKLIGEVKFFNELKENIKNMKLAGFSPEYIAGIYGNYGVESEFNPNAKERGGLGFGPFQYTPDEDGINYRLNNYKEWLNNNNLTHGVISNFKYLIDQFEKEDSRVEQLNNYRNILKNIYSNVKNSQTVLGGEEAFYDNLFKNKKDIKYMQDRVLKYLKDNNITLPNYNEIKAMKDIHTWAKKWIDGFTTEDGSKYTGRQSRTMWKTSNISVDDATEHFMDYYERPKESNPHLERRQKLANQLYPIILKIYNSL